MKIGIFTDTYYPQINGVATSSMVLKRELERLGHEVYIFTPTDPKAEPDPTVLRVPSMSFPFLRTHRLATVYPPSLLAKIGKLDLDVIHTQTEFPLGVFGRFISSLHGIPQVHTYHTMYVDYVHYIANGHLLTPKMIIEYSRIFCNHARIVITPADKSRDALIEYGVDRPIRIIPTGIDFTPFSPATYANGEVDALRESLGIPKDRPTIVTVGRVAEEKSIDVIVNGFAELLHTMPEAHFVIVGGGPELQNLKSMAVSLDIEENMTFTGFVPWSEIGKYYQLGDVFVSASTSETQGLTYLEAMAAHVPVVAKRDPSIENLIDDGKTGFFFNENADLPNVLNRVLRDKQQLVSVTAAALESILPLSSENFGLAVEKLYNELTHAYPKRRTIRKNRRARYS